MTARSVTMTEPFRDNSFSTAARRKRWRRYSSCVRQFWTQVAGSIEKISNSVVPIRAPSTMIRPVSKLVNCPGVVGAQYLELGDVLGVDLAEVRETRPVCACGGWRGTCRRSGCRGGLVSRVLFPESAGRRSQRQKFATHLAD